MFEPVNSRHLVGCIQTVARAELTAAIGVCKAALCWQQPFRIWTDSQFVVNTIQNIVAGNMQAEQRRKTNHDLVNQLRVLLHQVSNLFRGVIKVVSHQQYDTASIEEQWASAGNDSADRLAARVLEASHVVNITWKQMYEDVTRLRNVRDQIHAMVLAVSKQCLATKHTPAEASTNEIRFRATEMDNWIQLNPLPEQLAAYDIPTWPNIAQWILSLHTGGQIYRWSWIQLVVDFRAQLDIQIPWFKQGIQQWFGHNAPKADLLKQARNPSLFLQEIARNHGHPLPMRVAYPHSAILTYRTKTVTVSILESRQKNVEAFLANIGVPGKGVRDFVDIFG